MYNFVRFREKSLKINIFNPYYIFIFISIVGITGMNMIWEKQEKELFKPPVISTELLPDAIIINFVTESINFDVKIWELVAQKASHFEKHNMSKLEKIKLQFFKGGESDLTIVFSDFGILNNLSKDVTLISNVEITSLENTKIKIITGHHFIYNNSKILFEALHST